ncbi:unnamed protein product [Pleuronectes platessa]|uniref:Uncharacterized protein n=1 Tax=Pleuronectes platessa TaxID=8262 RepID=A0A9N7V890_PLEPL|nr:unnamed protein product [Pleuronectes platessa]
MHSYWAVHSLHPTQGHLSAQSPWADLHQRSICIFPDDAAVPWVVLVVLGADEAHTIPSFQPSHVTETRTGPLGCSSYDNLDSVSSILLQSPESKLHLQALWSALCALVGL